MQRIIIHGGCGAREDKNTSFVDYHKHLKPIVEKAYEYLKQTDDANKAAIYAARLLEDDDIFNAGTGSRVQQDGQIRMSASIMDSESKKFAGVINVGHDYNPSTNRWEDSTFVSGFDISGSKPKPFAFARAPGRPLNKFATDLYGGHLRVATTTTDWFNTDSTTVNQIFVFQVPAEDQGREMKLVGATGHLGKKNERITAVRFRGDRAYVVTFEQIDPFYVVDLGEPSEPKVIGALEIPGFSQYLHELELDGKKYMLGLGRQDNAIKIGLFDISDEKNPVQSAFHLEEQASSSAGTDSLAFRYLPISQLLIIPKSEWTWTEAGNFDGFVVYSVNATHISPVYESKKLVL